MKRKIFFAILISCISVIIICVILISGFLFNYYSEQQNNNLKSQLGYLVHMAEEHDIEHINTISASQKIMVLNADGDVIISNNANPEVPQKAIDELVSESKSSNQGHHTSTISFSKKIVAFSEKLHNDCVLIIVDTHHSYIAMLGSVLGYVFLILGAAALIAYFFARLLSRRILRPVYDLDISNPQKSSVYPELSPLIDKINEQNEEIRHRMMSIENEHEAQDKMRREFTANVSHELKTPLTSVSGYAELIRDGLAKEEDIPRFAGKIYDESKRMITLVGDIIKLSQLDEKNIPAKFEKIDLYNCCEGVIMSLESLAAKRNITFELNGDHCEISGAELIIEEIIHNICENAVKYNKENGKVTVSLRQCIDGVELSVTDTGIGIKEEDLPHIFERFYRADKSHSKEIGGTGLGLSIVKHGAQFHNAYVSVDSTYGEGTTIRVLF